MGHMKNLDIEQHNVGGVISDLFSGAAWLEVVRTLDHAKTLDGVARFAAYRDVALKVAKLQNVDLWRSPVFCDFCVLVESAEHNPNVLAILERYVPKKTAR